jgi:DNA-binding CsgD family transcriptional regulator
MGGKDDTLGPEERRLAALLATPLSLREIAAALGISHAEALVRAAALYRKLEPAERGPADPGHAS